MATDSSARMREDFANPFGRVAHLILQMRQWILLLLALLLFVLGGLEVVASHRVPSTVRLPAAPSMLNEAE